MCHWRSLWEGWTSSMRRKSGDRSCGIIPRESMRRILPSLPFLLLSALCLSQTLFALNGGPEISGSVNDPTGAVIQGAKVELIVHNEKISTAVTDHEGYYSLPVSAAGRYSIRVSAPGFKPSLLENLDLSNSSNITRNLTLRLDTLAHEVTVTATAT